MNHSDNLRNLLQVLIDVLSGLPGYNRQELEQQFTHEHLVSMRQSLLSGKTLGPEHGFDAEKYHQLPERLFVFYDILNQHEAVSPVWPELTHFLKKGLLSLKTTKSYFPTFAATNLFLNLIKQLPELLKIFDEKLNNMPAQRDITIPQDVMMAWLSVYAGLKACELYISRYPLLKNMIPNMNENHIDNLFERAKNQNQQLQKIQLTSMKITDKSEQQKKCEKLKKLIFLLHFIYQSDFFKKNHWVNHPEFKKKITKFIKNIRFASYNNDQNLIGSSSSLDQRLRTSNLDSSNPHQDLLSNRMGVVNILIQALDDVKTQASVHRQQLIADWINELIHINKKYEDISKKTGQVGFIEHAQRNSEISQVDDEIICLFQTKLKQLKASYAADEAPILAKWFSHLFAWVKTLFGSSSLARARKLSLWASSAFMPPCWEGRGVLCAIPVMPVLKRA